MKIKMPLMVLGMVLLIGIASALTYNISAGDTQTIDIGQVYDHYSITGNSTELNLNISQEGTIVTIIINKYSLSDTFDITFFNKENEVVYEHYGVGGSGGSPSSVPSINKTYPNCDFGAKKCANSELWYCKDGKWTSIICEYGCKNGSCIISEENIKLDGGKYSPQKGYVTIIVIFLTLVCLIFGIIKIIKLVKKSKGKKADEKQTLIQDVISNP